MIGLKMCTDNSAFGFASGRTDIRDRLIGRSGFRCAVRLMMVFLVLWMGNVAWTRDASPPGAPNAAPAYRHDRILIKSKPGAAPATMQGFHEQNKVSVIRRSGGTGNTQVLSVPGGRSVQALIREYEQSGLVEYAEPDYIVRLADTLPDDPKYLDGTLWGLNNTGQNGGTADADIDAPEGWDVLTSASNIVVAVIDTGVRYTHEDLAANMWTNPVDGSHGLNVIHGTNDPDDDHGHGTEVAGILGAVGNNGVGVTGVAWRVRIMACKFIDSGGNGYISDAIACIDFARTNGVRIINASWGDYANSLALQDAISSARDAGILFVAAAGNDSWDTDIVPFYPASYDLDNIVSVAATTATDELAGFSNFGLTSVDLGAPGTGIHSTDFASDSSYDTDEGTSMAAPQVAGALALLAAVFPTATHQEIIGRLLNATDSLPSLAGNCVTGGRLNLSRAIRPFPRLSVVPVPGGDPFQLKLSGEANRAYIILATTNLTSWSPVFTNFTGADGTFEFADNNSTNTARRFYRTTSVQ
jgi:subtilisin family serine protease